MSHGIRSRFDQELGRLTEELLELGSRARQCVADGSQAFADDDVERARDVIAADEAVNKLRYRIEETCYQLLAREQPVAGDLRAIVAGLVVAGEFERIADHGKKIARTTIRSHDNPRPIPFDGLRHLTELVLGMLDRILNAFARRDISEARAVCQVDDQADAVYKQTFNVTLSYMLENTRAISAGTYHLQVAHELERVGDRVTNVAERLIYAVTGEVTDLNA